MPRTHIIQSWVGAAQYPEGDEYSGEMIGDRRKPSIKVEIERSGDQWRTVGVGQHFTGNGCANLKAYSDTPKAKARQKTAFERITLADRHYSRLEQLSQELDAELENGSLSAEDWVYGRKQLDKRLDAGWVRLCKERGWSPEEKDEEIYSVCIQSLEEKRQQKSLDTDTTQNVSFLHGLAESLSEGNFFKGKLKKLLTAKEKIIQIITK